MTTTTMTANHTEREIATRALDHDCPDCGARVACAAASW